MRFLPHLLVGVVMLGCGSSPPRPPTHPRTGGPRAEARAGIETDPPLPLTLEPGDVLTITTVSNETSILENVVVDGAGRVHLPLIGDVTVGGQELTEAEARLEEATQRFDRFARVNVHVANPAGHRATVLGAVNTPGAVAIGPNHRIADLIASAGGPRIEVTQDGAHVDLSDLEHATVHRRGEALPINVARALAGDPRHNVRARPGDHVYVPPYELERVSVLGSVTRAGTFRHRRDMRLTEALSLAGGPSENADNGDIRIVRGDPRHPDAYAVSLHALARGESNDPILAPGDVVVVPQAGSVDIARVMTVLGPVLATLTSVAVTVIVVLATR